MENHVKEGDLCIDATAGNGNDTLFLCELVGECGRVLAFDIQKEAVENTKKRILEHQMEKRADVFLESHAKMQKYAKEGNQTGTATAEGGRHDESLHLQRRGQRI